LRATLPKASACTCRCALAGMRLDSRLGWLLWAYALVIFLGLVHLAWHYAVDGYVGPGLALLFWAIAGYVVSWNGTRRRPQTREEDAHLLA